MQSDAEKHHTQTHTRQTSYPIKLRKAEKHIIDTQSDTKRHAKHLFPCILLLPTATRLNLTTH